MSFVKIEQGDKDHMERIHRISQDYASGKIGTAESAVKTYLSDIRRKVSKRVRKKRIKN